MLSSLTRITRLKWLENLSPPSTSEADQWPPTASTVQLPLAPTTPKQAAAQSPTVVTCTQWKTPATCRCTTTDWQSWCYTSLIWSYQEGTTMPYWTDVNTTVMMWQDEQVQLHKMDQDLKTLKDSALKAYLPNQSYTPNICSISFA